MSAHAADGMNGRSDSDAFPGGFGVAQGGEGVADYEGGGCGRTGGDGNSFELKALCPVCAGDGWGSSEVVECRACFGSSRQLTAYERAERRLMRAVLAFGAETQELARVQTKLGSACAELGEARAEYLKAKTNPTL